MKKIVFLTALLSIVSITNAQDRQEAIRTQNVQKSWVKNIPFQALPLTRGAGEIIQIERNPKDPYQLYRRRRSGSAGTPCCRTAPSTPAR